ncbi:MAG: thioredoxin domain-containing protein [Desulfomonile tiedjei]|uniref:Thioredoxin domain-containing protein n=1 Tax=Desulfomonile tiedjei TaxID=2358 RepID=A0A9D6Z5J7_9BACT|nr:thioredoxin domain-containing protein [Desulfomonile tiedjei]
MKANRLVREKSPYLLQHAHNPVDWYPWGEDAFEKARKEDKPIFLSIGYSTCHWCHVMAHESFEDEETARLMNETFVSIKVDREERPDLDNMYMTVCQMMTGGGGWPLNIIMTPDKKPFFAGTYFPRESRYGRVGMLDLSPRIREIWLTRRDDALQSANKIALALRQIPDESPGQAPGKDVLAQAYDQLAQRFDPVQGGFSAAPKFPTPHNMLFLLRYWKRTGEAKALEMVEKTLQSMRMGGIYDHVGFGFHRYSTDNEWLVPHFEKMLYDQAMLAILFTEAYQATGKVDYAKTAREILSYVLRDMTAPEGGFYSAEDADSEGVEGKFYVWNLGEIHRVLGHDEASLVIKVLNLKPEGNFQEEASGRLTGHNIPHLTKTLPEIASGMGIAAEELENRLEAARLKLFLAREDRIHPHKDDKILTDWNGLMIAALSKAAQAFNNKEYADAARKAADFTLTVMKDSNGRLLHRFRDGEAALPAHVDDFAFFIWGLIELYETVFDVRYLAAALELNQLFTDHFWDPDLGGFYFTADDGEELLVRKKEIYDGASPSGNSVAALNLIRLGRMVADSTLEEKAEKIARAFSGTIRQFPSAYTQMLLAFEFALGPAFEVVIAGLPDAHDTAEMLKSLRGYYLPNKVVLLRPHGEDFPEITKFADFTMNYTPIDHKATAYVCTNFNCELPTDDPYRMLEILAAKNQ